MAIETYPDPNVGAAIKWLRNQAGLQQRELGEKMEDSGRGVSTVWLSQVETGHRQPSYPLVHRILAALQTTPSELEQLCVTKPWDRSRRTQTQAGIRTQTQARVQTQTQARIRTRHQHQTDSERLTQTGIQTQTQAGIRTQTQARSKDSDDDALAYQLGELNAIYLRLTNSQRNELLTNARLLSKDTQT